MGKKLIIKGADFSDVAIGHTPIKCEIEVVANNTSYGDVAGGGIYNLNSVHTITAVAKDGYHFVKWNDGNTEPTRDIVVRADATYTAEFAIGGQLFATMNEKWENRAAIAATSPARTPNVSRSSISLVDLSQFIGHKIRCILKTGYSLAFLLWENQAGQNALFYLAGENNVSQVFNWGVGEYIVPISTNVYLGLNVKKTDGSNMPETGSVEDFFEVAEIEA